MFEIKVDKAELLKKLKKNRTKHVKDFKLALEGYQDSVREELQELIAKLDEGKDITPHLKNRKPTSNEADYTLAIEMFEMSVDDKVTLNESQFQEYVKDNWSWKEQWGAANTGYITSASLKSSR